MRVVDTSLWIEYLMDGPLADQAEHCIKPLETCIVPAMVFYELEKWRNREFGSEAGKSLLSIITECLPAEMNFSVAIDAALHSTTHKLHATDAIIYATAQLAGAKLFTSDAHFKGLPGVEYFEK